ncbi:MAG TPA: peptide chain release factor N(5)-glutamine methyltransferase [Devosiaceae bacterium]|nr:peptide chain release factor N(5)-glutamine methyltransferase [Devosiaceae bacterium]
MTERPLVGEAWRAVRDRFRQADVDTPELDARLLAEAAFDFDRLALTLNEQNEAPDAGLAKLADFAGRRLQGEPVARILGHKEFYGLDFVLNDATLVPRPETELLVDLALEALRPLEAPVLLDLGTGSGCVAIAILVHAPNARAVATDLSEEAIAAARENAIRHGVLDRISFRAGSWCGPLLPAEQFDVVVSNPPYVESDIVEQLQVEVSEFDPHLALDGGEDGLAAYRAIAAGIPDRLRPGAQVIVEIGSEQGLEVGAIFSAAGFVGIDIRKDLAGLDRVVIGHQI